MERNGGSGGRELSFDHVVVGAGIIGSACAYHLSRRGARVALLEQFELGHSLGSSHGNSRIFRLAYDLPAYVRLAQSSRIEWQELELAAGVQLLLPSGVIDIGPPQHLDNLVRVLTSCGADTAQDRTVPGASQFNLRDGFDAMYQPDGGTTWANRAWTAFAELARAQGTVFYSRTRAESISVSGDLATVYAEGRSFAARTVVVTAAGWSNALLNPMGIQIPMRVTREHVAYYRKLADNSFLPFIWHPGDGTPETYGLPNLADKSVKVGHHIAGRLVDPGSDEPVNPEDVGRINEFVRTSLPVLDPEPMRAETCLYASTPDDDFVIDRVGRIVIGVGFGGHGFKFAPTVGGILADLAQDYDPPVDERFSLNRFGLVRA